MVGGGVLHGSSSSTIGTEPVVIGGHSISERRIVIASFSFALFVAGLGVILGIALVTLSAPPCPKRRSSAGCTSRATSRDDDARNPPSKAGRHRSVALATTSK